MFDAKVILQQLGGNKFIAMTGANSFVKDEQEESISFRFPRVNGMNAVKIRLTPMDLYDMEFYRIHGTKITLVKKIDGLYNDQIEEVFSRTTGLATRL